MPSLNKSSNIIVKLIVLIVLIIVLIGILKFGSSQTSYTGFESMPTSQEEMEKNFSYLSNKEMDLRTTPENEKTINLKDYSGECVIDKGGDYVLQGNLKGTLIIDSPKDSVHLFLNTVEINALSGPAILVKDSSEVVITLMEKSKNIITDNGDYRETSYVSCIYSTCDLTFNGTGSLSVSGLYKDAIYSKDVLKIVDGEYRIHAKRTGLRGNDGINVSGGVLYVGVEDYGFKTTKKGLNGRGNLMITGGDISIVAGKYAFVTKKAPLYIFDCKVSMNSVISDYDVKAGKIIDRSCLK